jgi:cbb3-type cytochrome oxidase subunit 3
MVTVADALGCLFLALCFVGACWLPVILGGVT